MAIKTEVSEFDFVDAFKQAGRGDNFTRPALIALYEYLWELSEEMGEDIEFDVIGICCEYSEYQNIEEFRASYGDKYETIEDIIDQTQVIIVDTHPALETSEIGFIIGDF